ncbi:hypothetical protein Sps_00848 [Shewanella psychrophila]|uniref:Uncharacterized protein n=1 Tax=Shewanella psychrophila TaxID=225848 RepID=A0A1S6HKK1_9GAMM|nr:hypothetical protein Sps_00848 [Shewanella psychrophila]
MNEQELSAYNPKQRKNKDPNRSQHLITQFLICWHQIAMEQGYSQLALFIVIPELSTIAPSDQQGRRKCR